MTCILVLRHKVLPVGHGVRPNGRELRVPRIVFVLRAQMLVREAVLLVRLRDVVAVVLVVQAIVIRAGGLLPARPDVFELRRPPVVHRVVDGALSKVPVHHELHVLFLFGIHEWIALLCFLLFVHWPMWTYKTKRLHRRRHVVASWVHVAVAGRSDSGAVVALVPVAIRPRRLALVLRLAV